MPTRNYVIIMYMSEYRRFYHNDYKYIFLTIVTNNRLPILIENIDLLRSAFKYAIKKHPCKIFACSILKDHIHIILELDNISDTAEIIRLMKYYFSRKFTNAVTPSESKLRKREKGIWQRRFWAHTIINEKDLYRHIDYIHYNSYKHYDISPQNWIYSTFNKFVNDGYYSEGWCNFNDVNNIENLNLE